MSEIARARRASILAVGTELTDGQVLDRNSAFLATQLVDYGFKVGEHRVVPDERVLIAQALRAMILENGLVFVTGGLGPTSDDFTRDVVAEVVGREMVFDADSWQQIEDRFRARGIPMNPSQRQQCFFPKDADILFNSAGTANGFWLRHDRECEIVVLPGPPREILAIWQGSVQERLRNRVALEDREKLFIWRCLGKGEGDLAERIEAAVAGSGLRVGYRAHLPYVEVKIWATPQLREQQDAVFARVDEVVRPWLVNRDQEDLAEDFLVLCDELAKPVRVHDRCTFGVLSERLHSSIKSRLSAEEEPKLPALTLCDSWPSPYSGKPVDSAADTDRAWLDTEGGVFFALELAPDRNGWALNCNGEKMVRLASPFKFAVHLERSRKFATESALREMKAFLVGSLRGHA